ncbi:MAG: FAD/NAD(P)-binding oxidoreductase [Bacteroidota bacterium]
MKRKTNTLILGGGFGGLAVAHTLRPLIPVEHSITLVSKSSQFVVGAAKTWVMTGERNIGAISSDLKSVIPPNVEIHHAEVQKIDVVKGEVTTSMGMLRTNFLVIALGADLNMGAVPGLAESALSFYTLEDALRLQERLNAFKEGELALLIPRTPFKCPPAPYEAAMVLHSMFKERGVREHIRISIYTTEPAPMPAAGPEMGAFIRDLLAERIIAYHPGKVTKSVDPKHKTILFESGEKVRYDLLIAIPPHESSYPVREAGLANQSGWIPVDPGTLKVATQVGAIPVYAIGDVTALPLPGRYKPESPLVLPKAGVFAASQGAVVARRIAAEILGKSPDDTFDGKGSCYIEIGGGQAVKGEGSFFNLPHPVMSKQAPSEEQFRDKQQWVMMWLKGNISS